MEITMTKDQAISMVDAWIEVGKRQVEDSTLSEEDAKSMSGPRGIPVNVRITTGFDSLQDLRKLLDLVPNSEHLRVLSQADALLRDLYKEFGLDFNEYTDRDYREVREKIWEIIKPKEDDDGRNAS